MIEELLELYRIGCYRKFEKGQLEKELLFMDAIEAPDSRHVVFAKKHADQINELVVKALRGEVDRYELYNNSSKYFSRVKYPYSQVLQNLVMYKAGEERRKEDVLTINEIGTWWENCGVDFYKGYIPTGEELNAYVETANWDLYIRNTRDMEGNNTALLATIKESYAKAASDEELIDGIYQYNDGGYLEMPDDVEALVWMIKLQQRWDLFVKVLEKLKYYPYQGCLIYMVHTVEECNQVINCLHGSLHEKVMQYLIREQVFRLLNDEEQNLKSNADGGLEARWSKTAEELYVKWVEKKEDMLHGFAKEWIDVFGAEELSVWVSRKIRQAAGKAEIYKTYELDVLYVIDKFVKECLDFTDINFAEKDLATLFNYALSAKDKGFDEQTSMAIFRAIVAQIYQTSYCPEWNLSEKGIELARAVYGLVSADKAESIRLLKVKHKPQEGYKVDIEKSFEAAFGESFLLSVLLLQVEESGDKERFKELKKLLYRYSQNGFFAQEDQFFIPFYIAELIASQVLKDEKEGFEKELIANYPQLSFVLRVLTANGGEMTADVKESMLKRVDIEWQWERKLMIQRKNEMWKVLEKYIEEVKKKK
jgi:hypothetical protein